MTAARTLAAGLAGLAVLAGVTPGRAQIVAGGVALVEHRVDAGYGVERSSGPVVAGDVGGGLSSRLRGTFGLRAGRLRGRSGGATDRTVAAVEARATYQARSWLLVDGALTMRTYSATVGLQRWVLVRVGGEARVPFLDDRMSGVVRVGVLPVASATGLGRSELAFSADAGMAYRQGRFGLDVLYALERYDFPSPSTTQVARHEQLSALVIRVSARRR